jgi:hypothetical protein
MTVQRTFSFQTTKEHSRRAIAPELCEEIALELRRGRREGRVQAAPMARQQQKKAGGSHHRLGRTSGLPCAVLSS